jgi:hypothetical protein
MTGWNLSAKKITYNLDGAQQRKKNYWFRPCYAFNYYAYTTCVDEASYI